MALFVPRRPAFTKLLHDPKDVVGKDLKLKAERVKFAARRQVGVKTGKLRASITVINHTPTTYGQSIMVGSMLSYARLHHDGSRPHVILPVRAPQLVFINKRGMLIRTNKVNHPGTRPNRYLTDNLRFAIL